MDSVSVLDIDLDVFEGKSFVIVEKEFVVGRMLARFEAVVANVADVAFVADVAIVSVVAVVCKVERIKEVKLIGSFMIGTKGIFSVLA